MADELERGMNMRSTLRFAFLLLFVLPAYAQDFEDPVSQKAIDLLPPAMLEGNSHKITAPVSSDGYTYSFTIESDFGPFEAKGKSQLAVRLQEIAAIAELKKITNSEAFAKAVGTAAMKPVESTANLVKNPVETAKGIPGGVKRKFENLGRWGKRGADKISDDENIDPKEAEEDETDSENAAMSVSKTVLGVTSAHRKYAQKVGVDPYSSNAVLQDELNRLAKYDAAGKFSTNVIRPKIPEIETTTKVNALVWSKDPFELRKLNEQRLTQMGVEAELSKKFLDHKILTPSDQTHIVTALDSLGKIGGRSEFIRAAISASSQDEVLSYRDSAMILEKMAKSGSSGTSFVRNPRLAMIRSGNTIIVILPADRLYYTESFAKALQKFLKNFQAELAKASKKELWLSGDSTKRARLELEKRGWTIRENRL
jgi:hypothetical protein